MIRYDDDAPVVITQSKITCPRPAVSSEAELSPSRRFFPDGEVLGDETGRRCGDDVGAL